MKNIECIKPLLAHKASISQELRNHFLILQKQITEESGHRVNSKSLMLYELLLWHIKIENNLVKYITQKCWEKLLYLFFHTKTTNILLSLVYQIIVIVFKMKNEKLLINLLCCQNMLAPMAKLFENREQHEMYSQEFKQHVLYTYSRTILNALEIIEESNDMNYRQLVSQLKFSANYK